MVRQPKKREQIALRRVVPRRLDDEASSRNDIFWDGAFFITLKIYHGFVEIASC